MKTKLFILVLAALFVMPYVLRAEDGLSILGDPMVTLNSLENCQDTIVLNSYDSANQSNVQIYRASSNIVIGDNYQIPTGKKIILDAPIVLLNPKFSCPLGAYLEVKNEGCFH